MRKRLRKYVAVVMTFLLCTGIWFQHGQIVRAAGEQDAIVEIYTDANTMVGSYSIEISNFGVEISEAQGTVFTGVFSLTADQTKGADGYLLYWYTGKEELGEIATGNTPTIDLGLLSEDKITYSMTSNEDGSVTYSDVKIKLLADYGESHCVTYYSNETQNGDHTSDKTESVYYYQMAVEEWDGVYNHPETATIDGELIENGDNSFVGWGTSDSGVVDTPPRAFQYGDDPLTLYARWQRPCQLIVNYYQTEADIQNQSPCYDPVTALQSSLSDESITFTTMQGPEMERAFFAGWQYRDETGAVFTLGENETMSIEIPEDGTDVSLDLYGIWSPVAVLQVTYDMGDTVEPYTIEVEQESISDTTFSFTTSSDVAPPTDTAIFEGWSYTNASGATVIIGAGEICSDIPITTTDVTLTAVWKEPLQEGSTVSAGTYTLLEGVPYTLGSGSWTVTDSNGGDNCVYVGGKEFYVPVTGDYTFVPN